MCSKHADYKIFIFICIYFLLTNSIKAGSSNVNFPSFFMENQGQFSNGSQYCLKSGKSNTLFA